MKSDTKPVGGNSESVKVIVRIRPMNSSEIGKGILSSVLTI